MEFNGGEKLKQILKPEIEFFVFYLRVILYLSLKAKV